MINFYRWFPFLYRRAMGKGKLHLKILRADTSDHGTVGVLAMPEFACYTIELPWRNNEPFFSCIKSGVYSAHVDKNTKIGGQYVIRFDSIVVGRSRILLHVANYAGDTRLGFKSDVEGCIGVGTVLGNNGTQTMLQNSRKAMDKLIDIIGDEYVMITIENMVGDF